MLVLGLHSKDRKSTRDKANISDPKVNRGCPPITANRTSGDCVQFSLRPSIQYIPLRVYHTGGFNAMKRYSGKCHQQTLAFFPKPNCQYVAINWIFCRNFDPTRRNQNSVLLSTCISMVYILFRCRKWNYIKYVALYCVFFLFSRIFLYHYFIICLDRSYFFLL